LSCVYFTVWDVLFCTVYTVHYIVHNALYSVVCTLVLRTDFASRVVNLVVVGLEAKYIVKQSKT